MSYGARVAPEEFARARRTGAVFLGAVSQVGTACTLTSCRVPVPRGTGRRLWLFGQYRGIICSACRGVLTGEERNA